eukprot:Phypoly_transcript_13915.p1 GENE.Phypoly_transcript_13915~~Phypoly_transcript_13915.p1  ORF type:complete len:295 (+),score=56.26 Phypoly_transcript_13915:71-955(+)
MSDPPAKRIKKDTSDAGLPFDEDTIKTIIKHSVDKVADVLPLMLVCKKWHKCAQDNSLWKSLFFKLFNTEKFDLEHYEGIKDDSKRVHEIQLIAEWRYDWFQYWEEEENGSEKNEHEYDEHGGQKVFDPPLEVFTNAIAFTNLNLDQPDLDFFALAKDFALLERIRKRTQNSSLGMSSESDYPFQPFICHYGSEELTEEDFMESIGANPNFVNEIVEVDLVKESDPSLSDDEGEGKNYHEKRMGTWLQKNLPEKERLSFYTGSDKLNPVPFFFVAKSPYGTGNVLGVISCLIHT